MVHRFLVLMAGAAAIAALTGCSQSVPTASAAQSFQTADLVMAEMPPSQNRFRVVENLTLPAPGPDPLLMIISLRQAPPEEITSEEIRVVYRSQNRAIVTFTQSGLPDDSVRAKRTRYELSPVEGSANGETLWKITQVMEQNRCQPGRGSQEWTGDLCN